MCCLRHAPDHPQYAPGNEPSTEQREYHHEGAATPEQGPQVPQRLLDILLGTCCLNDMPCTEITIKPGIHPYMLLLIRNSAVYAACLSILRERMPQHPLSCLCIPGNRTIAKSSYRYLERIIRVTCRCCE